MTLMFLPSTTMAAACRSKKRASGKAVVDLTEDNFKEMVLDSDEMWLVEFFAPWCGHCQKLAPEWESAAGQLSGSVNVSTTPPH